MEKVTALQAELALEFDLAIREYAAESIRPEMAKRIGEDEFIVEAMSTSYIARQVFEKVHEKLPTTSSSSRPTIHATRKISPDRRN